MDLWEDLLPNQQTTEWWVTWDADRVQGSAQFATDADALNFIASLERGGYADIRMFEVQAKYVGAQNLTSDSENARWRNANGW